MKGSSVIKGRYSSYRLHELIGKGGNAAVFRAVDAATGVAVAVKKVTVSDEATLQQWRGEVEALIALRGDGDKHVIRYLDHMQSEGSLLLVEEYAQGGSLLQALGRRAHGLPESQVARYVYDITCGLAYIHSQHIVHRDLKCANALLCGDDKRVKISDFGLATAPSLTDEKAGQEEALLGSVYWTAPETIRGAPHSASSDVWSLGCVVVELLTGKPPFFERSPINALYHIMDSGEAPIPASAFTAEGPVPLSEECADFMRACLRREAASRATASELTKHEWFLDFRILEQLTESTLGSSAASLAVSGMSEEIGQWVENHLFSSNPECLQWWLDQGSVRIVVSALASVTPSASFSIIRSFSYFAGQLRGKDNRFLTELGHADLWGYRALRSMCDPQDLVLLFCSCCDAQDPHVPQYAPSHFGALQVLIDGLLGGGSESATAALCVDALTRLFAPTHKEAAASPADAATEARRQLARDRLISDGGFFLLRAVLEQQCRGAFLESAAPPLGWGTLDKLFHVLHTVAVACGAEQYLLGSAYVLWGGADPGAAADAGAPVTPPATGSGGNAIGADSRQSSTAILSSRRCPAVTYNDEEAVKLFGTTVLPNEMWLVALLEASRNLCPHAIPIVLRMVRLWVECPTPLLESSAVSVVGTLLLILTASPAVPTDVQMELLRCLVPLQKLSARAAQCLRDSKGSLQLLAHVLRRPSSDAVAAEVLQAMVNLCEDDRMATAVSGSGAFEEAAAQAVCDIVSTLRTHSEVKVPAALSTPLVHALRLLELVTPPAGAPTSSANEDAERREQLEKALAVVSRDSRLPPDAIMAAHRMVKSS